jgi:hypothetical protein
MVPANPGVVRPMTCVAVFAALLSSCGARMPVDSASDSEASVALESTPALAQEPQFETGCARFEVRLRGLDSVVVARTDGPACGNIGLVLAGEPELDRTEGRVRLGIALENAGRADLGPPALVYGWEDSLRVTEVQGLARTFLDFVQPDSVVPAGEADLAGARVWRFDPALGVEEPVGYLAAGDTSGVRWLEIAVPDGVRAFTVVLGARAQPIVLIPATAPDSVPQAYYRKENVIEEAPCTLGPLLSNILVVSFTWESSRAERSAAVAAVDGVVVGGRRWVGFYLILVPDDGTGAGLCEAEARMRASPVVSMATPVMLAAPNRP